ncbi:hypothetical protein DFH08DRAFT_895200 [Mycena albidolilacea]|uniref:Uncharacterized protein n=1 Tax=Mycena albidolilacea TaxID=1033008 RepID=A0AAD7EDG8_9AGAR|nr:hypothetical protein DFH08DRAFT_895200 [Mycena albidolilacea]
MAAAATLFFTLLTLSPTLAALTNLTVDDSDLTYFTWTEDTGSPAPTIPWAAIAPGSPCLYCSAQPQTADIYQKTWHDGTNNSAGSLTFQGSAVYIYGIDLTNPANISFSLDGTFSSFHYYAGSAQFTFNTLFFSATDLSEGNGNHTVSWVLHATKTNGTTGLFDYAVITTAQASSSAPSSTASSLPTATGTNTAPHKSKSKTGPIVGGVIGGLVLLALLIALGVMLRRRRRAAAVKRKENVKPAPFMEQQPPAPLAAGGNVGGGGEKTLDVSWTHPTLPLPSSTDVSSLPASGLTNTTTSPSVPSTAPTDTAPAPPPTDTASTAPTSSTGETSSARERVLEARLAQLEAQVQEQLQPPPYGAPPA